MGIPVKNLKNARRAKGEMSQRTLAKLMGITEVSISRWERGEANPSWESLRKAAAILGTTTSYLVGDTDDPQPSAPPVTPSLTRGAAEVYDFATNRVKDIDTSELHAARLLLEVSMTAITEELTERIRDAIDRLEPRKAGK